MGSHDEPLFVTADYELVDFGDGRKLERFGPYLFDRPAPAAEGKTRKLPARWSAADGRFDRDPGQSGRWTMHQGAIDDTWPISWGPLRLELKQSDHGQLGLFPEQVTNWEWIAQQVRAAGRPIKVLNLFAYTGASTLAAAAAGAAVTHVDAASGVVAWARRNAEHSGLAGAPIRWIAEDARKFALRELKRGVSYDAVILDPPGYGHGPQGEVWKLTEHLAELWSDCLELTSNEPCFLLASCHTEPWAFGDALAGFLAGRSPGLPRTAGWQGSDLLLTSSVGQRLHCGAMARWTGNRSNATKSV